VTEWAAPDAALSVVVLGAHPDDIEIGCGGTLLRLADRPGTTVHGLVLTGAGERAAEAHAALPRFVPGATVDVVGLRDGRLPASWDAVKQALEDLAARVSPNLVLAPRPDDAHQDHRLIGRLATTVWRDATVLHYEIPKWDGDMSAPSVFVGLDRQTARRKVALLHESFPSQKAHDWWDDEVFLGLMRLRGMECRRPYAEAFHTAKITLDLGDHMNFAENG
jgi:LmbE family N-acetylglucosaminyl deacetylase